MINLDSLDWQELPINFDSTGSTAFGSVAEIDGVGSVITGYDLNAGRGFIAFQDSRGEWHTSETTRDWPMLDKVFGRYDWQAMLADVEEYAREELDSEDD